MQHVDSDQLESFAQDLIEALGTPEDIAAVVADVLVAADARGHGSHGTRRLATLYPDMITKDDLDPDARPEYVREAGVTAQIDGNLAWGHYIGIEAMESAIDQAEESGISVVGLRNATHLGRVGEFAERAAEQGKLFMAFVNTGGRSQKVTIPGSTQRRVATNPIAFGIPTYDVVPFPIVFDTATSQLAHGKIMKSAVAGKPLPEDIAISETGESLRDAQAFEEGEGAILPLGGFTTGYVGFGFSIVTELFGGFCGDGKVQGQSEGTGYVNNGAAFVVIDPEVFGARERHRQRVADYVDHVRSTEFDADIPTGEAWGEHAMLPGEREYEYLTDAADAGIPFDDGAIEALSDVADEFGIEERPASFE